MLIDEPSIPTEAAKASASVCNWETHDLQSETVAIFSVMLTMSAVFVLIRLYVRCALQTDGLGVDDWSIGISLVLWTAFSLVIIFGAIPQGLGLEEWKMTVENVEMVAFYSWVGQITYCIANSLVKLAFVFFYLRIFRENVVRRLLMATAAIIICYTIAFTIVNIWLCLPIDYFWKQWTDEDYAGTCLDYMQPSFIYSGIGVFFDIVIMAIPLAQLRKMKMSMRNKISVGLMFCVGTLYVFCLQPPQSLFMPSATHRSLLSIRVFMLIRTCHRANSIIVVSTVRFVKLLGGISAGAATSWVIAQIWTTVEVYVSRHRHRGRCGAIRTTLTRLT